MHLPFLFLFLGISGSIFFKHFRFLFFKQYRFLFLGIYASNFRHFRFLFSNFSVSSFQAFPFPVFVHFCFLLLFLGISAYYFQALRFIFPCKHFVLTSKNPGSKREIIELADRPPSYLFKIPADLTSPKPERPEES